MSGRDEKDVRRENHVVVPLIIVLVALLHTGNISVASAQQAIVSLPSADVTPEGHGFFMHESQVAPFDSQAVGWESTHFLTYGLGHHTELAVTMFSTWSPNVAARQTMALGWKSSIPLLDDVEELDLRIVGGAMGLVSVLDGGWGHWLYALASLELTATGTRLAAGASHGSEQLFGTRDTVSFIASVEQRVPWVHGLSVVGEWFSGSHDLANLIVGLTYHPDHTWIFVVGWKIPTSDAVFTLEEQGLVGEIGVFWH